MRWILSAIPQKDVEVTTLHAPVLLGYMLDRLTVSYMVKLDADGF